MMHKGRAPDGDLLCPTMPFASYTKVARADSDAVFAFLETAAPARIASRPNELQFPYSNRSQILGWRTLYFNEGTCKLDASKSADWNRGAYLGFRFSPLGSAYRSRCITAAQRFS